MVLHPLNQLLSLGIKWNWTTACDVVLTIVKKLVSNRLLVHYDSELPLRFATESPLMVWVWLFHIYFLIVQENRLLCILHPPTCWKILPSNGERGLVSSLWCKKSYINWYRHKFSIILDHNHLSTIFSLTKGIPSLAAVKMQLASFRLHLSHLLQAY